MSYTIKPFDELDIIDDFLANACAGDEEVGEEFSRTLVQALLQQELGKIRVSVQRVIWANNPNLRGIRLDIEVVEFAHSDSEFKKAIYDIEPFKRKDINLPKHNRFYQAKIDSRNLRSGEKDFVSLPNLYVITITDYDPFGYDYMLYSVHNKCDEVPEMEYEDGLRFLYFNTKGNKGGNASLKQLLNFIQDSKIANVTDDVTKKLHDCVSKVKVSDEVRVEYMMWEEKLFYEKRDAKEEGRTETLQTLIQSKLKKGKTPDEIAEILELSVEEVMRLINDMKETKN